MDAKRYYERAFLNLPQDEKEKQIQIEKFESVVNSVNNLLDLQVEGEEYFEITSELSSPLRPDEVKESTDREEIFSNTDHREYGYFKLDNIMED